MPQLIFRNYGGSYQLRIQDAADLEKIQALDESYWAATSVPINSLTCEDTFTAYVDTDKNGRIRSDELKAAQAWLFHLLTDRSRISQGADILRLDHIDTSHAEGKQVRGAADLILANLNLPDAQEISLAQVRDLQSIMARVASNGDGIIPPDAAFDSDIAQCIRAIMETIGSTEDASGKPGISEAHLNAFFNEAAAYLSWQEKGAILENQETTDIMVWGTDTPDAYGLVARVEAKLEQFFIQCALVSVTPRADMQFQGKNLAEIDFTDTALMKTKVANGPLAGLNPEGILDLKGTLNPLYRECLAELKEQVLTRALGRSSQLTEKQWRQVKEIFEPYRTWIASKQGTRVERLGSDTLRRYLDGPYRQQISDLITQDKVVADQLDKIHTVEKLILYQRWLLELANNVVSFAHLYHPQQRALFEAGTLVIDGRKMTFTVRVHDRDAHRKQAERSYIYLVYVAVTGRQETDITFDIVAAVTSGGRGGLCVGKRGVFFTTDGREWDAEVVDIIENPISLWELVQAPFRQAAIFVKRQLDTFLKSRQQTVQTTIATPSSSGIARDLLLGGSVAIAALGSAFAYITKALSQVSPLHVLVAIGGLAAIFLLPAIMIGYAKIRKRDIRVVLEASGWAVNVHMRLNPALGRFFTHVPRLPKWARKERKDMVEQLVQALGYTSLRSWKIRIVVYLMLLVLLGIIIWLYVYPLVKCYFYSPFF